MVTKLIGIREFRQNLASYTRGAKKGIRYVVLKKNVPVLQVMPIDEKEFALEQLRQDLEEAEQDIREGRVYSQEEIMREFGLL